MENHYEISINAGRTEPDTNTIGISITNMAAELLSHTAIQEEAYNRAQLTEQQKIDALRAEQKRAAAELEAARVSYNETHIKPEVIKAVHATLMNIDKSGFTRLCIHFSHHNGDSVKKFWFGTDEIDPMRCFHNYKITTSPYNVPKVVWRADVLRWVQEYLAPTNGKYVATAKYNENTINAEHTIYIVKAQPKQTGKSLWD